MISFRVVRRWLAEANHAPLAHRNPPFRIRLLDHAQRISVPAKLPRLTTREQSVPQALPTVKTKPETASGAASSLLFRIDRRQQFPAAARIFHVADQLSIR